MLLQVDVRHEVCGAKSLHEREEICLGSQLLKRGLMALESFSAFAVALPALAAAREEAADYGSTQILYVTVVIATFCLNTLH